MKLLLDQNLSPRLVEALADLFPGSMHVSQFGLQTASDKKVRQFAAKEGFVVVTKDSGFPQAAALAGHPPKVIWIRTGNCSTARVQEL